MKREMSIEMGMGMGMKQIYTYPLG